MKRRAVTGIRGAAAGVIAVLMISGCTTVERSAAIGGATGAVVGGAVTGEVGGAVAGGLIGAMAGALIGKHAESGLCVYRNPWGYRYRAPCW